MGYYINKDSKGNQLPHNGKTEMLIADGAIKIDPPTEWREGLVSVVSNGPFEAAGYAHSEKEMEVMKRPDGRPRQWLQYDKAKELAE